MSDFCCNEHFENDDVKFEDYYSETTYNWCTNCGNYGITAATKRALVAENIKPKDTVMTFDIGCNGNGSDKIGGYRIHGLHGRSIAVASGIALANQKLTVISSGGDGGTLSEGINHFIHAIRSNYNFVFLLHNNANYGLTKGQASAATRPDIPMNSSPDGTTADIINVLQLALNLGVSYAARTFSGDVNQMTEVIRSAINHEGFAIVEILQHCPSYNKITPHEWYQERVFDTINTPNYDNSNITQALEISKDLNENIATGVIYQNSNSIPFIERQKNREGIETSLTEEVKENSSIANELFEKFA